MHKFWCIPVIPILPQRLSHWHQGEHWYRNHSFSQGIYSSDIHHHDNCHTNIDRGLVHLKSISQSHGNHRFHSNKTTIYVEISSSSSSTTVIIIIKRKRKRKRRRRRRRKKSQSKTLTKFQPPNTKGMQ